MATLQPDLWGSPPSPAVYPLANMFLQTKAGPVVGLVAGRVSPSPGNPGREGIEAGQPLCSQSSLTFSQMEDAL